MSEPASVAVILGSAFETPRLGGRTLAPCAVATPFGPVTLYRWPAPGRAAWVLFRHGAPHALLPNQIPYRAHAAALREVGCGALLVTSAVALLDRSLPLDAPLLFSDLLMPENRLPDGSTCTMWPAPAPDQAHLVLQEGLFSRALGEQVAELAEEGGHPIAGRPVFLYAGGPRSKTAAENALWARLGAQANSMTVGPEVVLANELGIPTAGLGVAHKYSLPGLRERLARPEIDAALATGRAIVERVALAFLERARPVPFANLLYRYGLHRYGLDRDGAGRGAGGG